MTIKKITVKVEHKKTGEVEKEFDCSTDGGKADRLERALLDRVSDDYHVYISYEYSK
jgi:hypothetical protein